MQLLADQLTLSASDLVNFLECEHLTWLDLEHVHGRLPAEPKRPDTTELVARNGDEHERRHLEALRDRLGPGLVEIDAGRGHADFLECVERPSSTPSSRARSSPTSSSSSACTRSS